MHVIIIEICVLVTLHLTVNFIDADAILKLHKIFHVCTYCSDLKSYRPSCNQIQYVGLLNFSGINLYLRETI